MPKATIPFGELRPDLALLDNQFANVADNVFPFSNTYKPIPSLAPFSTASLPTPCTGLFAGRMKDGTWKIYAGTATRLYKWSYAGWTDISHQNSRTVSAATWASSVVTLTVPSMPDAIGTTFPLTVSGFTPTGYNGVFTGTIASATTITYPLATNPGAATVLGTALAPYNYNQPPGERWIFQQFGMGGTSGNWIVAVQIGDVPQYVDCDEALAVPGQAIGCFGTLGAAPIAHNCKVIGDFLFLGGILPGQAGWTNLDRYCVLWSAINDITTFVIGTNLCDFQRFPDQGPVQGVAGSEVAGYVVQDRGIRTLQFLPGDINFIFTFARVVKERGSISEFGFDTNADVLYFLAEDGFYALAGTQLMPIGFEKVNEFFLANSDIGGRGMVLCFTALKPYVVWAFSSTASATSLLLYDRFILYNWANQRWATGTITDSNGNLGAQSWATLSTPGLDLDTDDASDPPATPPPPYGDVDADSTSPDLDSFKYLGGRPTMCGVNTLGQLCALNGPNLLATLETAEAHLVPGQRAFVSEVYPLVDGAHCTVTPGVRERLGDPVAWGTPWANAVPIEITGAASVTTSARLHRFRVIVPFAEVWQNAQGVLAEAQPDGFA
jgi:hypothetical protein